MFCFFGHIEEFHRFRFSSIHVPFSKRMPKGLRSFPCHLGVGVDHGKLMAMFAPGIDFLPEVPAFTFDP